MGTQSMRNEACANSMMHANDSMIYDLRSLATGAAIIQLTTGHGEESVIVNTKQQLCKVRACLVTSYTWQHFKQQTGLTLKILYSNSNQHSKVTMARLAVHDALPVYWYFNHKNNNTSLTTWVSQHQKGWTISISMRQEMTDESGISCTICICTLLLTNHASITQFYGPDPLPNIQSTVSVL